MKKVVMIILTISNLLVAKETVVKETIGWNLILSVDDFNDKVQCHLYSKNLSKDASAGLIIDSINDKSKRQVMSLSGKFLGSKLTYRVDSKESVELVGYLIQANDNYSNLIESFKNGKEVKIKVTPKNKFANESISSISLDGFEDLYKLAEVCNFK